MNVVLNNKICKHFFMRSLGRPFRLALCIYSQYGALVQNIVFFRFDSRAKMSWEYMNLGPGNPGNVMGFCFPKDLSTL